MVQIGAKNISDEDIVLDDLYEDAKEVIITDKKHLSHIFKED